MALASNECLNAREQLGKRERLGQVIIAADLQTLHAIIDRTLRAEDEDRHLYFLRPPAFDEVEAIEPRQHQVHDRDVVVIVQGELQRVVAAFAMSTA